MAENVVAELGGEVRRRLDAGMSLRDVARWLYCGPAAGRPVLAIKILREGTGLGLAPCKDVVDEVIGEVDPAYFERGVLAVRREAAEAIERLQSDQAWNRNSSVSGS